MTTLQNRPLVAAPGPWAFPSRESFTLPNGLSVLVYRRPGQHVISAGLALDLPLATEDRAREGVASITAACLDQGTRSHPRLSFLDAVEGCGAELDHAVDYSMTNVYLDVPASHLAEALPLLAEAVAEPELDDSDVDRERALALARLQQQRANGSARADHAVRGALLDAGSRAARGRDGEPATLRSVTGEDVRALHRRYFGPARATLVLAGQFVGDVRSLVTDALGSWDNPAQERAAHETPVPHGRRLFLIDRPGAVQADVRVARFTIDRTDPRWADLQIAQNALGGAFLSRLNRVLREERGYTYGVHLATHALRAGGYTVAQGSFRNEVVADAVELIPTLLDVTSTPFTADEVTRARTYLAGVQPLQYATASGVCHGVMALLSAGLTSDFVDQVRKAYDRVTPESATRVAAELLPPDDLSLVVVGDAAALTEGLQRRGFGVEVLPADSEL